MCVCPGWLLAKIACENIYLVRFIFPSLLSRLPVYVCGFVWFFPAAATEPKYEYVRCECDYVWWKART